MNDWDVIETLNNMKGVFGEREHSQYSLYSINRAIAAIEKQIPVKLIDKTGRYLCPTCNKMYWKDEAVPNYCQGCGQKFNVI